MAVVLTGFPAFYQFAAFSFLFGSFVTNGSQWCSPYRSSRTASCYVSCFCSDVLALLSCIFVRGSQPRSIAYLDTYNFFLVSLPSETISSIKNNLSRPEIAVLLLLHCSPFGITHFHLFPSIIAIFWNSSDHAINFHRFAPTFFRFLWENCGGSVKIVGC